jgi:VacB/RNase II family 3'-5' exoribonuclease
MSTSRFDLAAAAYQDMLHEGFRPDFPPGTAEQLAAIRQRTVAADGLRDLRSLLWSSIDNDTSKDLDQIEYAERVAAGIRVLVGIADVDGTVDRGTPIDNHAADQTTTVYTAAKVFSMIPEELSTDITSLGPGQDRAAVVMEFVVTATGEISAPSVYRATVRNQAQFTYSKVGAWLEGRGELGVSLELQAQLKLQDEAAQALREQRHRLGALNFDRVESRAVSKNGQVSGLEAARKTRANDLIEDFMVAANEVMATTITGAGASSIRRVVKTPERWPRIAELAANLGEKLPDQPDAAALNEFLRKRKAEDPVHYEDLSLSVIKLMGPGIYMLMRPGDQNQGHFGLAAHDYTHSTAPNRRFADLVTQRLIKAVLVKQKPPYSDQELEAIARQCTLREDAARKVERTSQKRVAAVVMQNRVGEMFDGVITGVTPKGVFVRVSDPPVEGRVMRGEQGLDVGDRVRVKLLGTNPKMGFIDFSR